MNKKTRNLVIVILVVCVIVLLLLIAVAINGSGMSEQKIVNELTSMGEEIYSQYYYPKLSETKDEKELASYLDEFKDIGLKFNLTELNKYSVDFRQKISKFKSSEKDCDKDNTMIIIYPKSPYTNTDFSTEIKLDCGFKK